MLKKKVLSILALSTIIAGTVSASSMNGEYKGNEIVKVRVNGNLIDSEIPAQIIDGTTLLPLRAVSNAFGADVNWHEENYSVDLTKKNSNISYIKNLSAAADYYHDLRSLGYQFYVSYLELYFALNQIEQSNGSDYSRLNKLLVDDGLYKVTIETYNEYAVGADGKISKFKNDGIDVSDSVDILLNYHAVTVKLNETIENMKKYGENRSNTLFSEITKGLDEALNINSKPFGASRNRFNDIMSTIQAQ